MNSKIVKRVALILGGLLALFLILQIIPVWALKTNPPVQQEPQWDSPQTRALAQRACFDCHSNETVWPWYTNVAPVSWLIIMDTVKGRQHLNFSEWGLQRAEVDKVEREISGGSMPPSNYILLHPDAALSVAEKQQLIDGLQKTFANSGGG
jgi:mono/diheme cytochrome c family protein